MRIRRYLLLATLISSPALAQTFPPLAGRPVVDAADVIPPDREEKLNARLLEMERDSKHQIVVVTVPSLQGYDVETFANGLYRHYELGDEKRDDGVLLLNSTGDRKIRIEVGYGLEPVLTDARSGIIIRETIGPKLKAGDFAGGYEAGVEKINEAISQEAVAPQTALSRQENRKREGGSGALWWILGILGLGGAGTWWRVARVRRREKTWREEAEQRRKVREAEDGRAWSESRRPAREPEVSKRTLRDLGVETGEDASPPPPPPRRYSPPPPPPRYAPPPPPRYSPPPPDYYSPPPPPPPDYYSPPPPPPPDYYSPPPPPPPDFSGGGGSSGGGGASGDY